MKKLILLMLVGLLMLPSAVAFASPLVVDNFSFEADTPTTLDHKNNPYTYNLTGWTKSGLNWYAGTHSFPNEVYPGGVPDGNNVAFVNRGFIAQATPYVLTAGHLYTLSAMVGQRTDSVGFGSYGVELWAGADLVLQAANTVPAPGTFVLNQASYLATGSEAFIGQPLTIKLVNYRDLFIEGVATAYQVNFDDVKLSNAVVSPVPLPAGVILVGSGLLTLIGWRRKFH